MRIYCFWLVISLAGSFLSCNNTEFQKTPCKSFSTEILVYAKDSTGIFTYNPRNGENKRILSIQKEIVPETFSLINDSLLTFTTLESMKPDSVLSERISTDTNKVKHSYLSATYYWVVTEKVHLISLSDVRHYIPQINEYYVHGFQSQKFSTFGFPGIMTFCIPDTITEHGRYYINDDSCERYFFEVRQFEKFDHLYSESKTINGVKLVTYRGNLILMDENRIAGIHHYKGEFSQKASEIGYYSPDISDNGRFCTYFYKSHLNLDKRFINAYSKDGIFILGGKTGKQTRIEGPEYITPKLSAKGHFLACGSKKEYYEYNYSISELITVFNLINNTHTCIGEGNYYEWTQK